ncbi:MAG: hypothetical protein DGJ47_000071 [Rickettsiaceae bacterium]
MNFKDQGIIIAKRFLQDNRYVITVFTKNHGIYSGVIKQFSKKMGDNLVAGNLVDFMWNARLHEHLGYAKVELIKSYNAYIIGNKTKLYAFNSIISILQLAFCEREPHNDLFPSLLELIDSFKGEFSVKKYIDFELRILEESGYQLQLNKCADTGKSEDLHYISPKSGRAVSRQSGEPFAEKLLPLPQFLIKDTEPNYLEIKEAKKTTSYFINRYILINKEPPTSREKFYQHMLCSVN